MRLGLAAALALASSVALAAPPATFRVSHNVNVRAGPDRVFPAVNWIYRQDDVRVVGCLEDFSWCDVASGRTRGWIEAHYVRGLSRQSTPVVTFALPGYWDANYRRRAFFADKDAWAGWGTPGWTPPPQPRRRP